MNVELHEGDCLEILATLPDASVDAVVTDPPASISFMNREWDTYKRAEFIQWMTAVMAECLRVLKPGGHALVWAIPRTSHWTATAIEDAGFEVRDVIVHLQGAGFPKSLDVSKAIDKMAGAEREVVGRNPNYRDPEENAEHHERWNGAVMSQDVTAPATDEAKRWQGWGTALKPASEHWILARRPLAEPNVASQVLATGTGAINIAATRVGASSTGGDKAAGSSDGTCPVHGVGRTSRTESTEYPGNAAARREPRTAPPPSGPLHADQEQRSPDSRTGYRPSPHSGDGPARPLEVDGQASAQPRDGERTSRSPDATFGDSLGDLSTQCNCTTPHVYPSGRWPANLVLSCCGEDPHVEGCPVAELDRQSGDSESKQSYRGDGIGAGYHGSDASWNTQRGFNDHGGASRFFATFVYEEDELPRQGTMNATPCEGALSAASQSDEGPPRLRDLRSFRYTAKSSATERSAGLPPGYLNRHPTVKPVELMRWLCRLITPPGGTILDCFCGSGSTGVAAKLEGFNFIGIDQDHESVETARRRLDWAVHEPTLFELEGDG